MWSRRIRGQRASNAGQRRCGGGPGIAGGVSGSSAMDHGISALHGAWPRPAGAGGQSVEATQPGFAVIGMQSTDSASEKISLRKNPHFYPVILAGGRGTRFWPLSRKRRAKQLLALDGKQTMIQQTMARLLGLAPPKSFWVITNDDLRQEIVRQLPRLEKKQIL